MIGIHSLRVHQSLEGLPYTPVAGSTNQMTGIISQAHRAPSLLVAGAGEALGHYKACSMAGGTIVGITD